MKFLGLLIIAASVGIPIAANAGQATLRGPDCRKPLSGQGCTANGSVSYKVPDGMAINPGSLGSRGTVVEHWGKNAACESSTASQYEYFHVPGAPSGVVAAYITGFAAHTHIESGSGFSNLGMTGFVKCRYGFSDFKIPH